MSIHDELLIYLPKDLVSIIKEYTQIYLFDVDLTNTSYLYVGNSLGYLNQEKYEEDYISKHWPSVSISVGISNYISHIDINIFEITDITRMGGANQMFEYKGWNYLFRCEDYDAQDSEVKTYILNSMVLLIEDGI